MPSISGNPFDYQQVDLIAHITLPDGRACRVHAFYDGEDLWKVRFTATQTGTHRWRLTLNGKPLNPASMEATLGKGAVMPDGFVRLDRKAAQRFRFDSGRVYYPLGHNQGWQSRLGPIPELFQAMGRAGEHWSRVWMCHWDGKNLDWLPGEAMHSRSLSLEVARKWDEIVEAAEKSGIYLQMALQHHGPYSSTTDSNWSENPWNEAKGGFLKSPEEFFTHPEALDRTRMKYRYIIARWGYSPAVMAWELWNEVQWTDMARKDWETVIRWHNEMAAFLRKQDPFRHLVTSSSMEPDHPLYRSLDFSQPHVYTSGIIDCFRKDAPLWQELKKPVFYGEWGPSGRPFSDLTFLHQGVWSGIMTPGAGAPAWWAWDALPPEEIDRHFAPAARFLARSRLPEQPHLKSVAVEVKAEGQAPLIIAPQGGWSELKQADFTVTPEGSRPDLSAVPGYFQGKFHRDMFPESLNLRVHYKQPGTFQMRVGVVARAGAFPRLLLDGKEAPLSINGREAPDWQGYPERERDTPVRQTLEIAVPAGEHIISIRNEGNDWFTIGEIRLDPYAPPIRALALGSDRFLAGWVYHQGRLDLKDTSEVMPVAGEMILRGLKKGSYRLTWWNAESGKVLSTAPLEVQGVQIHVRLPAIRKDIAFWVAALTRAPAK